MPPMESDWNRERQITNIHDFSRAIIIWTRNRRKFSEHIYISFLFHISWISVARNEEKKNAHSSMNGP